MNLSWESMESPLVSVDLSEQKHPSWSQRYRNSSQPWLHTQLRAPPTSDLSLLWLAELLSGVQVKVRGWGEGAGCVSCLRWVVSPQSDRKMELSPTGGRRRGAGGGGAMRRPGGGWGRGQATWRTAGRGGAEGGCSRRWCRLSGRALVTRTPSHLRERERQTGSDHIRTKRKKKKINYVVFSSSPWMTSSLTSGNVLAYGDVNAAQEQHESNWLC